MADKPRVLSQQLVMTPQLQMAIRLLATPTAQLQSMLDQITGLEPASDADPDLLEPTSEEREAADEDGTPLWSFAVERPPGFRDDVDVWIAGDPPAARAGRHPLPHVRTIPGATPDQLREAAWFARALRQRAKTYERVVGALLACRPQLATAQRASDLRPVAVRELAEAVGMHESTVTRVAAGCRFQTSHGVWALAAGKRGIGITAA